MNKPYLFRQNGLLNRLRLQIMLVGIGNGHFDKIAHV